MLETLRVHRYARMAMVCSLAFPLLASAQSRDSLRRMSDTFETLAQKVSPAVVQILVTGYGPVEEDGREQTALIGRRESIGSGAIIDASGYIITNAHVVEGSQRVRVVLSPARNDAPAKTRILNARIAGVDKDTDLAVLKVEAAGLPTLPLGDYRKLRQGQLVLAFGSPEGLEDSVTMGVVSSVMRQPDPDEPTVYIQTDAAINPGNSGGPLVDVDGNLVGINTSILSQSGGNEGIGFAIPSVIVRFVYQEILAHGHVHRRQLGLRLQTITPSLAAGLKLPQDSGLIVSDVLPNGPADAAGVRVQDIVLDLDGTPVGSLPMYRAALYRSAHGSPVTLQLLRGSEKLSFKIPVVEEQQHELDDLAEMINPDKSLVQGLGILGIEINPKIAEMLPDLRISSGVLVAARAAGNPVDTGLRRGDVIHFLNGTAVNNLDMLRRAVTQLKSGDPVALRIERDGLLMYVAFESE